MHENILQSIGRTPLVRLRQLGQGVAVPVYVKVEAMNPGGSVKDRVAVAMIAEAEGRRKRRDAGAGVTVTVDTQAEAGSK